MAGNLFTVNVDGLRTLSANIRRSSPQLARRLRTGLRKGGELVATDARAFSSWSSRIPKSIRVESRGSRVDVVAGDEDAPHAAPFEHLGFPGQFRHPVFGNREVWVSQAARPFLTPAARVNGSRVADLVLAEITSVLDEAFGGTEAT